MNVTSLADVECPLNISSSSFSCENPYPNCTNSASFQFASLWVITQAIASCPNDTRLFKSQPMLTDASCRLFTHRKAWPKSWTPYPAADIWARLTTWKFPLLQLVAVFPRPPLSFWVEFFVLVHLLGDPTSTTNSLLLKMASCQARARFWKSEFENVELNLARLLTEAPTPISPSVALTEPLPAYHPPDTPLPSRDGMWKGLAAIVDSYDEWGPSYGNDAQDFIHDQLICSISDQDKKKFLKLCWLTANALAADRSTKFLPIIVAQGFFIGTIAIAFGRTKDSASDPNPATYINIEAHSIAFSSLYFWIIPAVIIGSIVGVSQTENAIPRILKRFKNEVHSNFPRCDVSRLEGNFVTESRERSGGIYSWESSPKSRPAILPMFIFGYSTFTGLLISYFVPPVGFECRHVGELFISLTWVVSACLNYFPRFPKVLSDNLEEAAHSRRRRFLFILWKDITATVLTMGGIVVTQVGVFNQCACYTLWGRTGLALPENDRVSKTLFWRINTGYPAIAFLCVGFQLIIVPSLLLRQYGLAIRVFLQRDDEKSNFPDWLVKVCGWFVRVWEGMKYLAKETKIYLGGGLVIFRRMFSQWMGRNDQSGFYQEMRPN